MEVGDSEEWRKESGLLIAGTRTVPQAASKRIWGDAGFRLFLSHKAEVKSETGELKDRLQLFEKSRALWPIKIFIRRKHGRMK